MGKEIQAVHIPSSHTKTAPPESFDPALDIPRSQCTWHTVLSSNLTPTDSLSAGIAVLPPKTGNLCPHRHLQAEIYYVISGSGIATVNGTDYVLKEGSTFFVPGDAEHGIRNTGDKECRWFYVFATDSFEEVNYRWSDKKEGEQKKDVHIHKARL
jgi:mannose-6-phosphate isomerase-like protein (cupin superfamily)